MKTLAAIAIVALGFTASGPVRADDDAPSKEQVEKIMALLESMRCQMDEDDIEVEDGEIELDDVYCGGGQFDIDLNEDMHITGMKAE